MKFNGPVEAYQLDQIAQAIKVLEGSDHKAKAICCEKLLSLPNTVSISFRDMKAYEIMPPLFSKVACSAGSACHTGHAVLDVLSPVLSAMSVPKEFGLGTLRLSVGRHTTMSEIDRAVMHISKRVKDLMVVTTPRLWIDKWADT